MNKYFLYSAMFSFIQFVMPGGQFRAESRDPGSPAVDRLAHWLVNLQFTNRDFTSYGAVRVHDSPAATGTNSKPYYRVSPYLANLALLGMIRSGRKEALSKTEAWIDWYFAHLNLESAPDGVPFEHFYLADGTGETVCVRPGDPRLCRYNDATDSAAATFFSLLWAWQQAGGSAKLLMIPDRKTKLSRLADILLALQQQDGLFWAKRDYRAKYLEDNCEVYAGLIALARLESGVFKEQALSERFDAAAQRTKAGIESDMFDRVNGMYYVAKFEDGNRPKTDLRNWYPDMQAQFWPVLFGITQPDGSSAKGALASLNRIWNGIDRPNWSERPELVNSGWISADVAYGALVSGERNRITAYMKAVLKLKGVEPSAAREFEWPFTAADAGWFLTLASRR